MGIAHQGHTANLLTNIHCISLYCDGATVVKPKVMRMLETTHGKSVTHKFKH